MLNLQFSYMVSSSQGFQTAQNLASQLPDPLRLPLVAQDLVGNLIPAIETGCVNMIQSSELSEVHHVLHHILVDAISKDWKVTLIDLANCFNPQKVSTIAFDYDLHGHLVLQQIGLARPFQIHQAVSIMKNLVRHINSDPDSKNLIVITDISSLFFDSGIANEDPLFPIPQLELMRQCVGILQSLAVQGYTVLITDKTERTQSLPVSNELPQIHPASLQYSSKLHIRIHPTDTGREIELVSHPYLPARSKTERDLKALVEARRPKKQLSLHDFF